MAITFEQTPDTYSSGFNDMMFVVSSDQTAQDNFRFYTRIKDGSGNIISEFRNIPYPGYSSFFFSPHRTIQTYLSYDLGDIVNQSTGWQGGTNVFKKYSLEIQEEYGSPVSGYVSGSSNSFYAVNSAIDFISIVNSPISSRIAGGAQVKWLTDAPVMLPIRVDDSFQVGTLSDTDNVVHRLRVQTFDASGNNLKTVTIANPNPSVTNDTDRFLSILVGPADLNLTTLTSGSQPVIEDNTDWYRVSVINVLGAQMTDWQSFKIDRNCTRSGSYDRLFWLNQWGRFDAFNFTAMHEDQIEVEKSQYERPLGTFDGTNFSFHTYQRQRSQFFTKEKQKYKLRSGFIDTDTAQWIKQLISSPVIYIVIDGDFVACTIEETNYTAKNTLQEKLFDIQVTVTLSVDTQRQAL